MKTISIAFLFFTVFSTQAQLSKKEVTKSIKNWYAQIPEQYVIVINSDDAIVELTRYQPERADEQNDIIEVTYKQMEIQLKFDAPFSQISTHPDSLQKHFSYVSLDRIYHTIPSKGWDVYPSTSQSVLRKNGVNFIEKNGHVNVKITWSFFEVFGYKESAKCNEQRSIADGSVSEDCYVSVRKMVPLIIFISSVKLY